MPQFRTVITLLTAAGVVALSRVTYHRHQLSGNLVEGTADIKVGSDVVEGTVDVKPNTDLVEEGTTDDTASSLTCVEEKVVKWLPRKCNKESFVIRSMCKPPVLPVYKKVCSRSQNKRCVEHVRGKFIEKGSRDMCVPKDVPLCTFNDVHEALAGIPKETTRLSVAAKDGSQRVAIAGCTLVEHTPNTLREILKGKRILLAGDSVIRQFYRKLTFIMRGAMWSRNYEYRSHSDEYYAANATHDFHSYEIPEGNPIQNGVEIIFLWQPLPIKFTLGAVEGRGDIDIHLFSVGNWWPKKAKDNGLMDNWAREVNAFADKQHEGYKGVFLTTSYSWKVNAAGHKLFEKRMPRLRNILTSKRIEAVNFRGYSQLSWFPRYDKSHFMCATRAFYPSRLSEQELKSMRQLHEAGVHNCHDDFNANLWLMLLNGLFNE